MTKRLTTQDFLDRAKFVHGNKYEYDKTVYEKALGELIITCPKHGDFSIVARKHTNGKQGCKECSRLINSGKPRKTTEDFIKKSKERYGEKYTYNNAVYINNKTKVVVTCREHDDFSILPSNHYKCLGGCKECAKIAFVKLVSKEPKKFVSESKALHEDVYNYSKTKYVKNNQKVVITCEIHGDFKIFPSDHLKGSGCQKCGNIRTAESARKSPKDFLEECKSIHGDNYIYDKVVYTHSHSKITVTCKVHGDFNISPSRFLAAKGCRKCSFLNNGHNRTKFVNRCVKNNNSLGNIYIIKCHNEDEVFIKLEYLLQLLTIGIVVIKRCHTNMRWLRN